MWEKKLKLGNLTLLLDPIQIIYLFLYFFLNTLTSSQLFQYCFIHLRSNRITKYLVNIQVSSHVFTSSQENQMYVNVKMLIIQYCMFKLIATKVIS